MKRFDFTMSDGYDRSLYKPSVVGGEADLPIALMEAMNDFLEAYGGGLKLPFRIEITATDGEAV